MRSDAGSTAPTGSKRVKLKSETHVRAEASVQEDLIKTAQKDATVATTQFLTALDDSAHGNVDELHFESHKFQVHCNEADVGFSTSSAGKTSQQSDWFEFDESYQVMLPGPGGQTTRTCAEDSHVAKLEENRRVYWLPGSATESTDRAPLCIKFRVARLVVEETPNSETDFDVHATQLEESEGYTQTQPQDITTPREQGQTRCTSDCTDSGSCAQTSGKHARGRRQERIISYRQTQQIHNT